MTLTRITVFLLQNVSSADEAINSDKSPERVDTDPNSGVGGAVFYMRSAAHPPAWVTAMNPILSGAINGVVSASSSGVLVLRVNGRWFAVSFGYGRSLIDPGAIVRQFGLKVALNLVDPAQLRSMDTKTFEDLVVSKSTQSSKSSELPSFGVDISRDILRGVAGVPSDTKFASRLHGADAITLVAKVSASDLPAVCQRLLDEYAKKDYKTNFGWIDQLAVVEDPSVRNSLDNLLIADWQRGNTSNTYMAAPETLDWEDIDHFTIQPTRKSTYEDLDLEAYLADMDSATIAGTTLKQLQQRGVTVH
jgi:uncharacterized protein (TIGR04141 family)